MAEVLHKEKLADYVHRMMLRAPFIAEKAKAGQFVILRIDSNGERFPLTIVDTDRDKGVLTLVFQEVGVSTKKLSALNIGERVSDIVGPLGNPCAVKKYGNVACVAGGVGIGAIYPITRALKEAGNEIISVLGARTEDYILYKEELSSISKKSFFATDDGSLGHKGFVTEVLSSILENGEKIDKVFTVGPAVMMREVANVLRPYEIPTTASLNPIMIDGTGMCGSCRVTVGEEIKFACVDGPEFDALKIDWNEVLCRLKSFCKQEEHALKLYCGGKENV